MEKDSVTVEAWFKAVKVEDEYEEEDEDEEKKEQEQRSTLNQCKQQ